MVQDDLIKTERDAHGKVENGHFQQSKGHNSKINNLISTVF